MFVAEGFKTVAELANSPIIQTEMIYVANDAKAIELSSVISPSKITVCPKDELIPISQLENTADILGVFHIPNYNLPVQPLPLSLYLYDIQDPGNLGTIIRLADWYGIDGIFVSPDTVDTFNFKTVMSTMGSLARVNIWRLPFEEVMSDYCIYPALMQGAINIHSAKLSSPALICIGNEGHGLPESVIKKYREHTLYIPGKGSTESLNAAMATAILLDNAARILMK